MKRTIVVALVLFGLMLTGTAFSQTAKSVNKREHLQKIRIKDGKRTGELTRQESRKLHREQRKIHALKAKAKSDGKVTMKERRRISHAQNKANRDIYRLKHNKRARL